MRIKSLTLAKPVRLGTSTNHNHINIDDKQFAGVEIHYKEGGDYFVTAPKKDGQLVHLIIHSTNVAFAEVIVDGAAKGSSRTRAAKTAKG